MLMMLLIFLTEFPRDFLAGESNEMRSLAGEE